MGMMRGLVGLVARVPTRVETKLLAAFLTIAMLLVLVGIVGLGVLTGVNARTEELIKLQHKIEAYHQVQHDITSQLYGVTAALLSSDDKTLSSALRQLDQFGYDVDRLQFVAKDEAEMLARLRQNYDQFVELITRSVELIRAGHASTISFPGPLRLGHQSCCDCDSGHKDDEELEGQGVAAIWFNLVNRHEQYGCNDERK